MGEYPALAKAMQRRAIEIAATFNEQGVANLMWGLAALEVEVGPQLAEVMQDRAIEIASDFNSQGVSNLMWAFMTLGVVVRGELLEAILGRAIEIAADFKPQEVANLVRACTCFDLSAFKSTPAFFDSMAARLFNLMGSQNPADQFTAVHKSQLHQWFLSCRIDDSLRGRVPESVMLLIETLGEECRAALPYSGNGSSESRLQENVFEALERTFPEMEILWEHQEPTSWYSIDILVRSRPAGDVDPSESRGGGHLGYAVEVDGPWHFLEQGKSESPKGGTLLKHKQLRQLGYTVVSVPFWEWQALKGGQEQEEYLDGKFLYSQ
ncbi:RAP domain-containing protein [Baffinella frigidus]|nr:RAP domain-containing protein [Cryptophyta sp. CCMP2293]